MEKLDRIGINIWDDYFEDGYVPEGEIQETYAYVEGGRDYLTNEDQKKILELLLNHLKGKKYLEGVEMFIQFYDSKLKYPQFVGTEHEWILFERWEIRFKNLSHEKREILVEGLRTENLKCNNIPLKIYSES